MSLKLKIQKLRDGAVVPEYQTDGASAVDLHFCGGDEPFLLIPGRFHLFGTGLAMEIPVGFEGQVRPRSGLALKHGITVLNTPGTIDADYRGEVKVLLINLGAESYKIRPWDRIAQLVIAPVIRVDFEAVEQISPSVRAAGGFGSTGK